MLKLVPVFIYLICYNPGADAALLSGGSGSLEKLLTSLGTGVEAALKDLGNLKVPGTLDDLIIALFKVTKVVQDIGNAVSPGLGDALKKTLDKVLLGLLCGVGSPGLTGKLLGNTPGILLKQKPKLCDGADTDVCNCNGGNNGGNNGGDNGGNTGGGDNGGNNGGNGGGDNGGGDDGGDGGSGCGKCKKSN